VLSYPAHLVRDYISRFGVDPDGLVLDPFCGTGTTLVECKKLGIRSVGIESNPMASFASQVKVDWSVDPKSLLEHADHIAKRTWEKLEAVGMGGFLALAFIHKGAQARRRITNTAFREVEPVAERLY